MAADAQPARTCQVDACPAFQVAAHQLPKVVAGHLVPEPVCKPPGLVRDEDGLVLWAHALVSDASEVPGAPEREEAGSAMAGQPCPTRQGGQGAAAPCC